MSGMRLAERLNRKRNVSIDSHAMLDLDLYMENEGSLYSHKLEILKSIRNKIARGKYDPAKASKLWAYWVEHGAKMYAQKQKGKWSTLYPKPLRDKLARELATRYATGEV